MTIQFLKQKLLALLFIIFSCTKIFAQDFYGFVKKTDSTASPVYQATVEITEGGKPFKTLKTYFDGAFKFTSNKEKSYTLKISYNGYKDTTYSISTDKKGTLSAQNVTVRLKKDGMRLMGVIKSQEENFPIKDATIVLKNVMTRKEERITTNIDGRYNFKLEYETNYKISIDKRALGIFNKYKDTSFYVSTIGFNQPLDYKLDITLDPVLYPTTAAREEYVAPKQTSANSKPVTASIEKAVANNSAPEKQPFVEHDQKLKGAEQTISKLQEELEKAKKEIEDLKGKENEQKKSTGGIFVSKKPKTKEGANLEVVVIRELTPAEIATQREVAEKKEKQIEEQISKQTAREEEQKKIAESAKQKEAEAANKKAEELALLQKTIEDSITKKQQEKETQAIATAMQKQKAKGDSMLQVKIKLEIIAQEIAAKKQREDSFANATASTKKLERIETKPTVPAERNKYIQDSIHYAKQLQTQRKKDEEAMKKREADEKQAIINAALALKKAYEDSVKNAIALVRTKFIQDSITKAKAEILAREKIKQDSIAQVKATQEKTTRELALKEAVEDSVKKTLVAARAKFVQDSITKAKTEFLAKSKAKQDSIAEVQKVAKEVALRKAMEDSVRRIAVAARTKFVLDSASKAKAEILAREKIKQDSTNHVKAEQAKIAKELAVRKAKDDSLNRITVLALANARKKASADSAIKIKQTIATKEKVNSIDLLDSALASWEGTLSKTKPTLREKFVKDSVAKATVLAEKKAKELAVRKVKEDSIAQVKLLAREKLVRDSTAKAEQIKNVKELAAKKTIHDSIVKVQIASQKKITDDSISQAKTAEEKNVKEIAAKKAYEDSLNKAMATNEAKIIQDSLAKVKAERERIARETEERKQEEEINKAIAKAMQDSIVTAKSEKQRKALAESLANANTELSRMATELAETKRKTREDSIAKVKADEKATEQKAKELAEVKKKNEDDILKHTQEALAKVKADEKAKKELLDRKKVEETQAAIAIQNKALEDSIVLVKKATAQKAKELAEVKKKNEDAILKQKQEEATARTKEEETRKTKEIEANSGTQEKIKEDVQNQPVYPSMEDAEAHVDYPTLPAILFEKNEFVLNATAKAKLKEVVQILLKVSTTGINIYALASSDESNSRQLALRRSDAMLHFFIANEISIDRIKSLYYGTSVSRNGCTNSNCPEELQKQNRAVLYQIILR